MKMKKSSLMYPSQINRGRPNTLGAAFQPVRMPGLPNLLPKLGQTTTPMGVPNPSALNSFGRGRGRPVGSYKPSPGASPTPNSFTRTTTNTSNQGFIRTQRILPSSNASSNASSASNNSNSPVSLIPGLANSSSITIQVSGATGRLGETLGIVNCFTRASVVL